jgi:hypothetical protein
MDQPSRHPAATDIGGWPPSTGSVSAWGETDGCATATTNPHPPATREQATSHRGGWRLPAPHRPSGLRLPGEELANAGAAVRCSSSIRAIPEDRGQQCRQGQPTMHASYGHPSGPAARPGLGDRLACWRRQGPYLSTTTLKASVGRKPQQPVLSPAKKIRPDRCGAATLRPVAANAPTASNPSTSRVGGGCKMQWPPRPRRCRPVD